MKQKWKVEGALILTQVLFGLGAIFGKLGVETFNPVLFATIREACAGPILTICAFMLVPPSRRKIVSPFLLILCGFFIFINQLGFIVGEKLASAAIGSAWQPTQPIMTAAVGMVMGTEQITTWKLLGMLLAATGASFMVLFHGTGFSGGSGEVLAGNIMFFMNCAGTAGYVITSRQLMRDDDDNNNNDDDGLKEKLPSLVVVAYSYMAASVMMAITGISSNLLGKHEFLKFVCGTDQNDDPKCTAWGVPTSAIGPLTYWILIQSVLCYFLMTWGNKWSGEGSNAVVYTALQPLTSGVVSWIMVTLNNGKDVHGVKAPGWEIAVGGAIVVLGLILVTVVGRRRDSSSSSSSATSSSTNFDEESRNAPLEPLLNEQHKIMHLDNFNQ